MDSNGAAIRGKSPHPESLPMRCFTFVLNVARRPLYGWIRLILRRILRRLFTRFFSTIVSTDQ